MKSNNPMTEETEDDSDGESSIILAGRVYEETSLEDAEDSLVWMLLSEAVTSKEIIKSIKENGINVKRFRHEGYSLFHFAA